MDDTELLVTQLETRSGTIGEEIMNLEADIGGMGFSYRERINLEERLAETEARAEVVRGYVKKARRRLDRLRGRYKDLIVGGRRDVRAETGGYRSSSSSSSS